MAVDALLMSCAHALMRRLAALSTSRWVMADAADVAPLPAPEALLGADCRLEWLAGEEHIAEP